MAKIGHALAAKVLEMCFHPGEVFEPESDRRGIKYELIPIHRPTFCSLADQSAFDAVVLGPDRQRSHQANQPTGASSERSRTPRGSLLENLILQSSPSSKKQPRTWLSRTAV